MSRHLVVLYEAYSNKNISIFGGGDSALDWALELSKFSKITLIHRRNEFRGAQHTLSEIRKLEKEGRVENSNHTPRGMLEFWLDPESPYFKEGRLDMNKEMVLFCAGGMRSALAAKTLKDMGFENVSHIDGGFGALRNSKFKIV